MLKNLNIFFILLLVFFAFVTANAGVKTEAGLPKELTQEPIQITLSYKEWKSEQIQSALAEVVELRRKQAQLTNAGESDPLLARQIQEKVFNLELKRDLTIRDYFSLYLVKQEDVSMGIAKASLKMTSHEIAELMSAYAKELAETSKDKNNKR